MKITPKITGFGITMLFVIITSCSNDSSRMVDFNKKTIETPCLPIFIFDKSNYNIDDPSLQTLFKATEKIDSQVASSQIQIKTKNTTKFGKLVLYRKKGRNIKLISDIHVRDLNLAATKHEIFFVDPCNIIAKMTRYSFHSKRIKSIYYFVFHKNNYIGCITTVKRSFFHKSSKWLNISNETIAKNWSNRIYHNIIRSYLF